MDELFKKAGSLVKSFKDGLNNLNSIDVSGVLSDIEDCSLYSRNIYDEKEAENAVLKYLRAQEGYSKVHQQFSVGGNLALKIDIDIDERIGIEIKLAEQLTATNAQRLLGQVLYYSKRKYQKNLIVLIVGNKKMENDPIIKELQSLIEDDLGVHFIYKIMK